MEENKTLHDRLWLWGQSPDVHWENGNPYKLPGHSRMTAVEGCHYFDIPNICRVRMMGHPMPPYDQESEAMLSCRRVVWSLLGAAIEPITEWGDMDEVARQAKLYDNIVGGVFDDFFTPERIKHFTPDRLRRLRDRLAEKAGRKLDTWVVCYEDKLDAVPHIDEYLKAFDAVTFWTWKGSELNNAVHNIERIKEMAPGAEIFTGCYMWNYGEACPLTREEMEWQLSLYERLVKEGVSEGIIVCSNCIADLGIENVRLTRDWIKAHKNDAVVK